MKRAQNSFSILLICFLISSYFPAPAQAQALPAGMIAFTRSGNIWVIDANGQNLRQITTDGKYYQLSWSKDASKLAFIRYAPNPPDGVEAASVGYISFPDEAVHIVVPPEKTPFVLLNTYYHFYSPRWGPDESTLYYAAADGTIGGQLGHTININTLARDAGFDPFYTLGFDVSFVDGRIVTVDFIQSDGGGQNLNLVSPNGGSSSPIFWFRAQTVIADVQWQRDGSQIAFAGNYSVYGSGSLNLINPDSSGERQLSAPSIETIALSPSGEYAAYTDGQSIYIMNLANGTTSYLTSGEYPAWASQSSGLSGTIYIPGGPPLANVTVNLSNGRQVKTDAAGHYVIDDLADGLYTITPQKNGFSFEPISVTVNLQGKQTHDFYALPGRLVTRILQSANVTRDMITNCDTVAYQMAADGDYFAYQLQMDRPNGAIEIILDSVDILGLGISGVGDVKDMTKMGMPGVVGKSWDYLLKMRKASIPAARALPATLPLYETSENVRAAARTFLGKGAAYFAADFLDSAAETTLTNKTVERAILDSFTNTNPLEKKYYPALISLSDDLTANVDDLTEQAIDSLPYLTPEEEDRYYSDINMHDSANIINEYIYEVRSQPLHQAHADRESWQDQWFTEFATKYLVKNLFTVLFDGPGLIGAQLAITAFDIYKNYNTLSQDEQFAGLGTTGMFAGYDCVTGVHSNFVKGISNILNKENVQIPSAENVWVQNVSVRATIPYGNIQLWERESYTEVHLYNPDNFPVTYKASAVTGVTGFLGTSYRSIVEEQVSKIDSWGTVRIPYKTSKGGVSPDANANISIDLLGSTDSGLYFIQRLSSSWNPDWVSASPAAGGPAAAQVELQDDSPVMPYPLSQGYEYQPDTKQYQGWLRIDNPLDEDIVVDLYQAVPAGVQLIDPDPSTLQYGQIYWWVTVPAHSSNEVTFIFTAPGAPGMPVTFDPAVMYIHDPAETKWAVFDGESGAVETHLPLIVSSNPPARGTPGSNIEVPFALHNPAEYSISGRINVIIEDIYGNIYSTGQAPFTVADKRGTALKITLPSPVPEAIYVLKAVVTTGSGSEEISQTYLQVRSDWLYLPAVAK